MEQNIKQQKLELKVPKSEQELISALNSLIKGINRACKVGGIVNLQTCAFLSSGLQMFKAVVNNVSVRIYKTDLSSDDSSINNDELFPPGNVLDQYYSVIDNVLNKAQLNGANDNVDDGKDIYDALMIFKDLFASIKKSKIENQKPIRKEKSSESVHLLDSIETINE